MASLFSVLVIRFNPLVLNPGPESEDGELALAATHISLSRLRDSIFSEDPLYLSVYIFFCLDTVYSFIFFVCPKHCASLYNQHFL